MRTDIFCAPQKKAMDKQMSLDPKSVEGGAELTSGALLEKNRRLRQQFESAEATGGQDAFTPLKGPTAKTKGF